MRKGRDVAVRFPGLCLVHQNLPGRRVKRYGRPEHLVFLPLQGEIELTVGSRVLRGSPGRFVYLPPETVHGLRSSPREGERLIALVEDWAWDEAGGMLLPPTSVSASPVLREGFFYLLLHPGTRAAPSLLRALIAILAETCGTVDASADLDHLEGIAKDPRLRAALAHLRARLSEPLSISGLAEASGVSVRSLNRLFAKELGLSPKAVVVRSRVERARDLLASGKRSVTEAALAVGYSSMSQFVAAFRKATGQLPSEFVRAGPRHVARDGQPTLWGREATKFDGSPAFGGAGGDGGGKAAESADRIRERG